MYTRFDTMSNHDGRTDRRAFCHFKDRAVI